MLIKGHAVWTRSSTSLSVAVLENQTSLSDASRGLDSSLVSAMCSNAVPLWNGWDYKMVRLLDVNLCQLHGVTLG